MGDVAMSVPVIRAFSQQYPDLKISVLTRELFTPFFRDLNNVTVVAAEVKTKHKGLLGLYKLAQELNKTEFYAVADLHNVLRTKILKKFINCHHFVSIDKGRSDKKNLTCGRIMGPLKSTHQRYADVFNTLGYSIDLANPTFPKKIVLAAPIKDFISDTKKNIGIAPFAAHAGKMYPLDLMEDVIKELSLNFNIILFGGGEKEESILNTYEQSYKHVYNAAGKLKMSEEMDVISNIEVMLSMDSGNAHIAAMLGIKVITIWGVTHPYAGFAPFNQSDENALLSDRTVFPLIPTSVYGNKYPDDYKEASRSISPLQIINKIKSIF